MRKVPYPHPGEILLEEFLKPMEITQYRLAKEIGVPQRRIGEIVAGKRAVTADTGLRLSRFFDISDAFWIGLQMDYDTTKAKDSLAKTLGKITPFRDKKTRIRAAIVSANILLFLFCPLLTPSRAQTLATTQADNGQQMESWWADLQQPEPECSRALLNFSTKPVLAVAFFKEHLKPLNIEQNELDDLLQALASDDEKIWKPAFEKLGYFDPRLNVDLQTLIQNADDPVQRNHLIEVLCDLPPGRLKGREVKLRPSGQTGDFIFFDSRASWWAEGKISRLDTGFNSKKQWVRADRAIVLLEHIATPDAIAVLQTLATGNPDAQPTKIAAAALKSLGAPAK